MQPVRCKKCDKMLGELTLPYKLKCKRCGEWNIELDEEAAAEWLLTEHQRPPKFQGILKGIE